MRSITLSVTLLILALSTSKVYAEGGAGITYHGRLMTPGGDPVRSLVSFRIQLRTPGTENCLMYEEVQTKDLRNTDGIFTLSLNDGTGSRTDSLNWGFDKIFSNRARFDFPVGYCSLSTFYIPSLASSRRMVVSFNDGTFSGYETFPPQVINYVPISVEAMQVGGYKAENLMRVDGVSSVSALTSAQYTNFMHLLNGTSTQYVKSSDPVTDTSVQSFARTSLPTCAVGKVLTSNGTGFSCVDDQAGSSGGSGSATVDPVIAVAPLEMDVLGNSMSLNLAPTSGLEVLLGYLTVKPGPGIRVDPSNRVVPEFSTANEAGKVVQANDPRLPSTACTSGSFARWTGSAWACEAVDAADLTGVITQNISSADIQVSQLRLYGGTSGGVSKFLTHAVAPGSYTDSYVLRWPAEIGAENQTLGITSISGTTAQLGWITPATGGGSTPSATPLLATAPLEMDAGNTTVSLNIAASSGLAVQGGALSLNLAPGLIVDGSNRVAPDFATTATAGKVVQANDARLPATVCASGSFMRWSGSGWVCSVDQDTTYTAGAGISLSSGAFHIASSGVTNEMLATGISGSKISGSISGYANNVTGIVGILNGGTGATTDIGARMNLGLKGAAVLDVGQIAGTVAAGDDNRFLKNWRVVATNTTAIVGDRLLVDSSGGALSVTLPAAPTIGATVSIIDAGGAFATNRLLIVRNGENIMGLSEDMEVTDARVSFDLVYAGSVQGWRIK